MSGPALAGRRAIVTGASRGIGRAIAEHLVAAGATVTITGRERATIARTAAEIGCKAEIADATDPAAMEKAFAAIGPADILVNNAGAALSKPFLKQDLADWNASIAVNLTGTYLGCRLVLAGMVERRWGRIINIASTAGHKGYAYTAAYCAAKHGVIGLTRAIAVETARSGVTVNAICPGFTDTDMAKAAISVIEAKTGRSAAEARGALEAMSPQNRLTDPKEVAEAVIFLCGENALGITGQSLIIAGGEIM